MKKFSQKDFDDFVKNEDSLNLKLYLRPFYKRYKLIKKIIFIFFLIGLFVAFLTPKEYASSVVFIPQTSSNSSSSSGLGSLAIMAGINLNTLSSENVINENHYPMILSSNSFKKELLKEKIYLESENKFVDFESYYNEFYNEGILEYIKKYTIGLPKTINDLKNNLIVSIKEKYKNSKPINNINPLDFEKPLKLTNREKKLYNKLSSHISLNIDSETGVVIIESMMHDPDLSAQFVNKAFKLFQKFVIDYKVKKSNDELKFLEKQFLVAEKKFIDKQIALSTFEDSNLNLKTSLSSNRLRNLQSEYQLSNQIYSTILQQIESQKIKVNQDSPVFTIIEDSEVPLKYTNPKRVNLVLTWIVYGLLISSLVVYYLEFYFDLKNKFLKFIDDK